MIKKEQKMDYDYGKVVRGNGGVKMSVTSLANMLHVGED